MPAATSASSQLDLFEDSAERMLFNDLADALSHDHAGQAHERLQRLADGFPSHPLLAEARLLIDQIGQEHPAGVAADADTLLAARALLQGPVSQAARDVLGADEAARWLPRRWMTLAQAAAALPYRREQGDAHAAALYLAGGHWAQAADAARGIESWRRIPTPLAWVAAATAQGQGLDIAWPLLAELCWLAPLRACELLQSLPDRRLPRWLQGLETALDLDLRSTPQACAWLPAWLLVDEPRCLQPLSQAQAVGDSDAERAMRLLAGLLRLEREGRQAERLERRRQLQQLQPQLFAAYMKTR